MLHNIRQIRAQDPYHNLGKVLAARWHFHKDDESQGRKEPQGQDHHEGELSGSVRCRGHGKGLRRKYAVPVWALLASVPGARSARKDEEHGRGHQVRGMVRG